MIERNLAYLETRAYEVLCLMWAWNENCANIKPPRKLPVNNSLQEVAANSRTTHSMDCGYGG